MQSANHWFHIAVVVPAKFNCVRFMSDPNIVDSVIIAQDWTDCTKYIENVVFEMIFSGSNTLDNAWYDIAAIHTCAANKANENIIIKSGSSFLFSEYKLLKSGLNSFVYSEYKYADCSSTEATKYFCLQRVEFILQHDSTAKFRFNFNILSTCCI